MKKTIEIYSCDICKNDIDKSELLINKTGGSMNPGFETSDGRSEHVAYKSFSFIHLMTRKIFLRKILFGRCETIDICNNCSNEIKRTLIKLKNPTNQDN